MGVIWSETLGGRMDVGADSQPASQLSGLTLNRIPFGNALGGLQDSANLTFDGTTLALTGAATISTTLGVTGVSTLTGGAVIDAGTGALPTNPSNTLLLLATTDGQFPRIFGTAYANSGMVFSGRCVGGTRASPTGTPADTALFALTGLGYDGGTFPTSSNALYEMRAGSLWTSGANRETYHRWTVTANGATASAEAMRLASTSVLDVLNAVQVGSATLADAGFGFFAQASGDRCLYGSRDSGGSGKTYVWGDGAGTAAAGTFALVCTSDTTTPTFSATSAALTVNSTTASTSTTTGALVVLGGCGISGAMSLGGALQLGNAYVGTPQVGTGYVTIKDSTGTTYKVLVAT